MRLIDADALIESMGLENAVKWGNKDGYQQAHSYSTMMLYEIKDDIDVQPTIEAVPLDKLCLLLHDIAGCPCHTQPGEDMCNRLIGDQCNTEWDDVECWKRFLTKWMEGLDDHG